MILTLYEKAAKIAVKLESLVWWLDLTGTGSRKAITGRN